MEASAPNFNECAKCKQPIPPDHSNDDKDQFVQHAEKTFPNVVDCQKLLNDYKKNPQSVYNICYCCLIERRGSWASSSQHQGNTEVKAKKETKSKAEEKKKQGTRSTWYNKFIIFAISAIFAIGGCVLNNVLTTNSPALLGISNDNLDSMMDGIKNKFPSLQRSLLKKLRGAFLQLQKTPGKPFVFLLLHDDSNKITTDCLASYTSILAKENIFTNSKQSLWINASEWTQSNSYLENENLLFDTLIEPLKKNEVLVLENLQDLPWVLANDLHFLCDSENPQIAKAMYILELRVNSGGLQQLTDEEKLNAAEGAMNIAWTDAPISFREALLSRLTSYVDAVLLESDDGCSGSGFFPLQNDKFIRISPNSIIV